MRRRNPLVPTAWDTRTISLPSDGDGVVVGVVEGVVVEGGVVLVWHGRIAFALVQRDYFGPKRRRVMISLSRDGEFIAKAGYDPVFGARPLKRFLQRNLETRIGRALIAGDIPDTPGARRQVPV